MVLPFDDSNSTKDDFNTLIVSFLPEYSITLSTKARVPVKITVECIRALECEYWDELYIYDDDIISEEENEKETIKSNFTNSTNETNGHSVNEFTSIEDFFKKLDESEKNEKEIIPKFDAISINSKLSNYESPLIKSNRKDSVMSEINVKKENILFENNSDNINIVNPFGERWSDIENKIKRKSQFKKFDTYQIKSFIIKSNDDLRQELMVMQIIKRFDEIFKSANIPLTLQPYEIIITSATSGIVEFLPNTISIDGLKRQLPPKWNLNTFIRHFFNNNFEEAQKNFARSLAAYSIVCYIMNIKDRHNGNILLDMNCNIIHIDFGFILGSSPGNLSFENSPFKLTEVNTIYNILGICGSIRWA